MKSLDVKKYSISFDLSTTNVGISLWNGEGKLVELKHWVMDVDKQISKEERYIHKADLFKSKLVEYKKHVESKYACVIENVFIEEPLPNTKINRDTVNLLMRFNGIACYILYQIFQFPPMLISVYESRKLFCPELIVRKKEKGKLKEVLSFPKNIDKKEYIWKKVAQLEPNVDWIYGVRSQELKQENYDLSDSYCVGIAGLKLKGILN